MGLSLSKRRRRRRRNEDHHNQSPISIPPPSNPVILQPQSLPSSPSSTFSNSSSTTLQILPPPPPPPPPLRPHHNQSPISIPPPSNPVILQPQSFPSSPSSTSSNSSSTTLQILPPPPPPPPLRRRSSPLPLHYNQSPISIPPPSDPLILQPQSLSSSPSSPSSTFSNSSSTTLQILPPPPPPPQPLRRRSSPLPLPPPPPPPPPLLNLQRSFLSPPSPSPFDFFTPTSLSPPHISFEWSFFPHLPPPPPPSYLYAVNASYPADLSSIASNSCNHTPAPMVVLANPRNGSTAVHSLMLPSQSRPPYVTAEKINNDVNVHKDSIKLDMDTKDLGSFLVSFIFDALVDGCITILYFAKEEENCTFTPLYAECCMRGRFPFQKGLNQKFFQPSGTGIDLGFFAIDELLSFNPEEGIFPLIICVETCLPPLSVSVDAQSIQHLPSMSGHAQVTQAVLEKNNQGQLEVRVIEQILWVDGVSYELLELYGIGNSGEGDFDDSEQGKECVICMAKPNDTAVLPCRHLCMCSPCSEELRIQSNKCPICRQLIEELVVIKVD